MTTRQLVYTTLIRVLKDGAYSNIAIDKAIKSEGQLRDNSTGLDKSQKAFITALFYGVLENYIALDYTLKRYVKKGLNTLDIEVLTILRMGFYQLVYFDTVRDSVAVDECVKLTAFARKASAKGFVNAVMRSFIRDGKELALPKNKGTEFYSVKYSCPQWLLEQWTEQYDEQTAIELAKATMGVPPITIRVNTLKTTPEKLIGYLDNRGVKACPHEYMDDCLVLTETGSIDKLPQYKQGLFYVQDVASQLCAKAVCAAPGQTVLDVCSAPGSKAFTIAQHMQNEGELYAFDMYEHKLKLIDENAKRLGITVMKTGMQDATQFNDKIPMADRVLCDVPCSGLGIIRRKPEIKYKDPADFLGLPALQYSILENCSRYVKVGGYLIYSTCTTNKNENEEVVRKFIHKNNSFQPLQLSVILDKIKSDNDFFVTLMPHIDNCDGFFIAAFERTGTDD